ncbi:hypothetical protein SUGI_0198930 [Cryptomeria japonica]|uniref:uncharacterized protein LOC131041181 n=1 Tax=Cryptomeria japonica TaxID=3369 RepID=UPI0024089AFF|nr:uncharacterized protein LOC131041181 [Cryptomeria japonica]GLJ12844.1 hypothetical protein SUGI_0198930 [Cryptomeria japonica]
MDSSAVKDVAASWRVLFLFLFIFFSTKSMGTQSGVDKRASPTGILPNAGDFATRLAGRIVGHSADVLPFEGGKSVVKVRKLRRGPLVPPSPKPLLNLMGLCLIFAQIPLHHHNKKVKDDMALSSINQGQHSCF